MKVLALSLIFWWQPAKAQLDSSSAVLLRMKSKPPVEKTLDTTRYKMRTPESRKEDDIEEEPGTYIPSPVPKKKAAVANTKPAAETPAPPTTVLSEPPPPVEEHPPVSTQVRDLVMGGTAEDIEEARKQFHPEDPRNNMVNIALAPAYFYQGSSSNYSPRRYHTNGPGLGLGMNFWLTPFFGLQSKYFTSVSSSVRDGANMVPMEVQDFEAGLRFRRHFGYSRKSAHISWGIDYHDNKNQISKDSTSNIGAKTSGLSLGLEGVIPTSNTHSSIFSVSIRPFQHHSEMNTALTAKSGVKGQSNGVSFSYGSQWNLDRQNQIYWKMNYSVERNLFTGPATLADPQTGSAPNGVSVTNSLVIFYFGFKWGS